MRGSIADDLISSECYQFEEFDSTNLDGLVFIGRVVLLNSSDEIRGPCV